MNAPHVLIAGAGHAGGRVAQALRAAGFAGRVTLVGDEPYAPYERPALSKDMLVGAKGVSDLVLQPHAFWQDEANLARRQGRIVKVSPERSALLDDGATIDFDILVVATGGAARRLAIPGADAPEVRTLRTMDDCLALRPAMAAGRRLVVIGGGVIGMEAAASAVAMGMRATVLEGGARVMARCLPPEGSHWLQALHVQHGVSVETDVRLDLLARKEGSTAGVSVVGRQAGAVRTWDADLVLVAVGIAPDTAFLEGSGVALDNGVLADENHRNPGAPWCYAVGDIANMHNPLYGRHVRQETWRNAENGARAVAAAIVGAPDTHVELPWMWTDQHGRNIQVVGMYTPGDLVVSRIAPSEASGVLLWLHEGRVAGGMLVDCGRERKQLEALVRRGAAVDAAILGDPAIPLKELAK
ncbi:NAD(P)/FAD-dependent oxidoreductase [Telluria beijingensis]|uniref:NAD(P)/FAD-dependent oxidoreductase n=1 Tax=Telluria beijingensis TaxID=3068633 RepID=UPI0027960CC9|nr:FAD-dependent oxidoreductase [Massilia sp. REN29]